MRTVYVMCALVLLLVCGSGIAAAAGPEVPPAMLIPRDTAWVKDLILVLVWGVFIPAVVLGPVIKYFSPPPKPERRVIR